MADMLTIHKDILKREHAKSPLGKMERNLTKFYDNMKLSRKSLPEDFAKRIFEIRESNEKKVNDYIEERLKHDREAVDKMLLDSMTNEFGIINEYLQSTSK